MQQRKRAPRPEQSTATPAPAATMQQPGEGRKDDTGKPRLDLIPPHVLVEMGKVLTFGAKKYGANRWQRVPNFTARYTAAMMRHIEEWRAGVQRDAESGLPVLAHVICNVAFLLWEEMECPQIARARRAQHQHPENLETGAQQ